eukprot:TRINITY_DN43240_c0_g1_i1.p1 TRINITY_DN43240_c0_g1~~TRINITY_DN43240_c0_g1_i1.p1  ORF type:complete len:770 (+),score=254.01 TRINITY_DN43240_c0_g1_i1:45-2354(+)
MEKSTKKEGGRSPAHTRKSASPSQGGGSGEKAMAWLEGADLTPKALLTHSIDISGLSEVISKLVAAVVSNTKAQEKCRQDCDRCLRAVEDVRRICFDAEGRAKTTTDAVAQLQSDIRSMGTDKVDAQEFGRLRAKTSDEVKGLRERCDQLQQQKVDCNAPQLERDARRHALETVKDYYSVQSREQRQWVERRLEWLGQGLRREDTLTLEKASAQIEKSMQELGQRLQTVAADTDQQLRSQSELVRDVEHRTSRVMDKLREHEKETDDLTQEAHVEAGHVRRDLRALMKAFGISPDELSRDLAAGWDAEEEVDIQRRKALFEVAIARDERRLSQWRAIHFTLPKGYQPPEAPLWRRNDDELASSITQRRAEQEAIFGAAQRELRRRKEALERAVATPAEQAGEWSAWSSEGMIRLLVRLPVFVDLRETVEESIERRILQARDDVTDDLSQQILAQGKDMKTKINATRCVELINEHTGRVFQEQRVMQARLDELGLTKVDTDACHAMMREKADLTVTDKKMDRQNATDMFEFLNAKIEEVAQDSDAAKLVRDLSGGIDDLRRQKLDRNDPEWLAVLGMVSGGGISLSPQMPSTSDRPGSAPMSAFPVQAPLRPGEAIGAAPPFGSSSMVGTPSRQPPATNTPKQETQRALAPQPPAPLTSIAPPPHGGPPPHSQPVTVEGLVARRRHEQQLRERANDPRDMQVAAAQDVRRQREKRRLGDQGDMTDVRRLLGDLGVSADTPQRPSTAAAESMSLSADQMQRPHTSMSRSFA